MCDPIQRKGGYRSMISKAGCVDARIDFRWVGELEKLIGSVAGMVPLTRDVSTVNNLIDTGRSKDRRPPAYKT